MPACSHLRRIKAISNAGRTACNWRPSLLLYAGLKAWRRSRFASSVRLLTDLDEDGLKYVLKNLPAWVKVRPAEFTVNLSRPNDYSAQTCVAC